MFFPLYFFIQTPLCPFTVLLSSQYESLSLFFPLSPLRVFILPRCDHIWPQPLPFVLLLTFYVTLSPPTTLLLLFRRKCSLPLLPTCCSREETNKKSGSLSKVPLSPKSRTIREALQRRMMGNYAGLEIRFANLASPSLFIAHSLCLSFSDLSLIASLSLSLSYFQGSAP